MSKIMGISSLRIIAILGILLGMLAPILGSSPASASSVTSASFTGGTGTVTVGGTVYAKQGGALTLTVNTTSDTNCVMVTGDPSGSQTQKGNGKGQSSWTFQFTAGAGNGPVTVTATAYDKVNQNGVCAGSSASSTASYTLDNAGPQVTAVLSPAPNGAGWDNSNITINWSATDAGSGVASGPTPATASQTTNTSGTTFTSSATDRLGNTGTGSVTVKLDKESPTITGSRSPAANSYGWNNTDVTVSFTCSDGVSGIKSCTGTQTVSAEGTNQLVAGTAVDNADNSSSATVSNINIDKTAPKLSGAPTTSPSGTGPDGTQWYQGPVTIRWTASDDRSGLDPSTIPADSTITGDGKGLVATASVKDKAGNQTIANSQAVNIDQMAPITTADAPSGWNNKAVTVKLSASDNLSGVKATYYTINGGAQQTYDPATGIAFSSNGTYTLNFWSVDYAGNAEDKTAPGHTATVKIDQTPPSITDSESPAANSAGWYNSNVAVTFTCDDQGGSGVKSCGPNATVTSEGLNQTVTGTAVDNAGNQAADTVYLNVDKTAPTITGATDRAANANGWYNAPVTVSFTCVDGTSGVKSCTKPVTLSSDGANQSATGSATDNADNSSSATVGGINIDQTAPSLSAKATADPNANGWYNGDVTVDWSCSDATSGLAGACPADSTISGEGNNLSASASVSDKAGNTSNVTVSGIKIDRTAPSTQASVSPDAPLTGWYTGPVQVTLNAVDSLSGVDKTFYSVDDSPAQQYSDTFTFGQGGKHTLTFWSTDKAGNTEDKTAPGHSVTIQIDNIAPTIKGSRSPDANSFGWNNGPVSVSFNCSDAESGIKACDGDAVLSKEGAGQSVTGTATDNANNTAQATVGNVNIDLTAPNLSGAPTTDPNAKGWYNGDVTIHWTASDPQLADGSDGSGIDPNTMPSDSTITGEGAGLTAQASVSDKAGNSSGTVSSQSVNIDRTNPTISSSHTGTANASGWYKDDVKVTFACDDPAPKDGVEPSGVASCTDAQTLHQGADQSVKGTAVDNAGNSASTTAGPFNIDETAPSISGAITTDPSGTDANGIKWYNTDVKVGWNTSDDLSGVDPNTVPADSVITGEGNDLSASASVQDLAGNQSSASVTGVHIDRQAPVTSADAPSAWVNQNATVQLSASDNLSGVKATYYTIDGGAQQTYDGNGIDFSSEGVYTLKYWSVDYAGNVESANTATVKIDKTAPTITDTHDPAANDAGWNNTDVKVSFACDDQGGSGLKSCGPDQTVTSEGKDQSVTGTAADNAGNTATDTTSVSIDKTNPTISGAATTKPNANGWYNSDVMVHYTCADPAPAQGVTPSGVASCAQDDVVKSDGADQSVSGSVTDAAGNTASTTVGGINLDEAAPTISGAITTDPSGTGADGMTKWYNTDVKVHWTCDDNLSGVVSCPADSTVRSEDSNASASASVSDKAGNSATATVGGIHIDRTAPTTSSNAPSGWQNADVTVKLSASDNLSGVKATHYSVDGGVVQDGTSVKISSDGTHTIEFWSEDYAGNVEKAQTVQVQLDKTSPVITGAVTSTPNGNGWFSGPVTVHFSCSDATSGVASCPADVQVTSDGKNQSVTGVAVDNAGNTAGYTVSGINIDTQAPSLSGAPTSEPNANGWYNGDVTIHWTASDALSDIAPASQPADSVIKGEGNNLSASASVSDLAGNQSSASVTGIQIDRTAPATAASVNPATPDGANGWYISRPAVTLSASDNLSGVDKTYYSLDGGDAQLYTGPVVLGDGTHTITYWSVDKAGNVEDKTAAGHSLTLKVDSTKPDITINGVKDGATYTLGNVPTASCAATASGPSGVGSCSGSISGGTANGVGTFTYTATATNGAGQSRTRTATYRVIYRWDGFLQPINDTAHSANLNYSIFKAGSTVPVKFQLKKADGTVVQENANNLPVWLTPVAGAGTAMPVDESAYAATATTGGSFRWDSTSQQYIYNWQTSSASAGKFFRIGVKLDDGQTYSVVIGLR